MTLSDKIIELRQHREAIRTAIVAKGGVLPLGSHMSDYPNAIEALSGGGGEPDLIKSISIPTLSGASLFEDSTATELDLRALDTSNMVNMANMFAFSQATKIDVSSFDTSNVTDMNNMFQESQATTLDLSSFDTSNVTNMDSMFQDSQATTGYARAQADADRFNASLGKPAALTFVVKGA